MVWKSAVNVSECRLDEVPGPFKKNCIKRCHNDKCLNTEDGTVYSAELVTAAGIVRASLVRLREELRVSCRDRVVAHDLGVRLSAVWDGPHLQGGDHPGQEQRSV